MWTCMWFHSWTRLKASGNSPLTVKRKIFFQKQQAQVNFCWAPPRSVTVCGTVRSSPALERTAFLWNYKKIRNNFAVIWMQILCLNFLFLVIKTLLSRKIVPTFKWRSSSQILFATAIVFFRDKNRPLANCGEFFAFCVTVSYFKRTLSSTASFEKM